jgi:hypothetical protein
MTDIMDDYFDWRAEQEDRIGTHGDRCHMWPRHERCMIHRLARALEDARLTDRGAAGYRLGVRRLRISLGRPMRRCGGCWSGPSDETSDKRKKSRHFLQIK